MVFLVFLILFLSSTNAFGDFCFLWVQAANQMKEMKSSFYSFGASGVCRLPDSSKVKLFGGLFLI